jgi:prolyl oligopeptidase
MRLQQAGLFGLLLLRVLAGWADSPAAGALVAGMSRPPTAKIKPVVEELWGQTVTDDYRYMERLDEPTLEWMRVQGKFTRSILDSIQPLASLRHEVENLTAGIDLIQSFSFSGRRAFFEERVPGSTDFVLKVADSQGTQELINTTTLPSSGLGRFYAINYYLPSPDGTKVAVGISENGSEDATLSIYDVRTRARVAGPVDRAQFGPPAWSADSRGLFFDRLRKLSQADSAADRYEYPNVEFWRFDSEPRVVVGPSKNHGPALGPDELPLVITGVGTPYTALMSVKGVENEISVWITPTHEADNPTTNWRKIVDRADGVTHVEMSGSDFFLLSHQDAPTFKVLRLGEDGTARTASVLMPARSDRVIESIRAASDALYVLATHESYSQLLRVTVPSGRIEEIPLPIHGHVSEAFSRPNEPGIAITLSSWLAPSAVYFYDPVRRIFEPRKLAKATIRADEFLVRDLTALAGDGVAIPLTLIQQRDTRGPHVAILEAYGSYGDSLLAEFNPRRIAALRKGITYGVCHVRGGGELGESWRLAGKDANKRNSWSDLIACAQDMVRRGVTTQDRLFIFGGSAGGIAVGRALTERPDLFAGALDLVPIANTLRLEFSANGPANVPEFGTVADKTGFENLYAMDTIQHLKKGVQYPAIMITAGLNDPRVEPWQAAKVTAALQATGSSNPTLLRFDERGGHGPGATKGQTDTLTADFIAFVLWRAGLREWQPGGLP